MVRSSRGVIGVEVWVKVAAPGDPPSGDPGGLAFLVPNTRTPAGGEFTGPEGG